MEKYLFIISVDGVFVKEAQVTLNQSSQLMAKKVEEPVYHLRGWINRQIAISVTWFYLRMFCGARLPSPLREHEHDWDSGSNLGLAQ